MAVATGKKHVVCQVSKMATKEFTTRVNEAYMPGDSVRLGKDDESSEKIILGPGLRKYGKEILVTKPGILRTKSTPTTYWIDCHHKRVSRISICIAYYFGASWHSFVRS